MNNPRSNLLCHVVYSQSETGRQTVLHTEVHLLEVLYCVQLNLAMITVHLTYTKWQLSILRLLSMSDGQIGCHKQVKP